MTSKRNKQKFPGLQKSKNLKIRHEVMEEDYLDKLNNEEKDWLDRFNREFNGNEFTHGGKILHKTKKLKRACAKRNNDRNADEYAIAKSKNRLTNLPTKPNVNNSKDYSQIETANRTSNLNVNEDIMITMLDIKEKNERELERETLYNAPKIFKNSSKKKS